MNFIGLRIQLECLEKSSEMKNNQNKGGHSGIDLKAMSIVIESSKCSDSESGGGFESVAFIINHPSPSFSFGVAVVNSERR